MMRVNHMAELFSLEGRVALVAGGSRGIGRAIAIGLGQAGASVIAIGRTPTQAIDEVDRVSYRSIDITDRAGFKGLCSDINNKHGQIDIYVHAAGISLPAMESSQAEADRFAATVNTNLVAPFQCVGSVTSYMKPSGSVILISSINATLGFPDNPGYVAAKGGLTAMTRALAVDLGKRQIRVNSIAPGYVHTKMTELSYQDSDTHKERMRRTILGRWGEPEDLAGAAIFLASKASAYVTGQEILVDGGWSVKGL